MNKVIVITGASSGMGEAVAKLLASSGYNVVLGARREDRLKQICDDINKENKGKAVYLKTDVTNKDEVEALAKEAIDEFGQIDVWYNNAGIMFESPFIEKQYDEWNKMLDINIKGTLYGIGAVLPYMTKAKKGQIINVSSVFGHMAHANYGIYAATKWAIRAISESLREECAPNNIRVTILSPGAVKTEMTEGTNFFNHAIDVNDIAITIKQAIELPEEATWNEVIIRPTKQVM